MIMIIGRATVRVIRTGDTSGVATVQYATSDGTALERSNYTHVSGKLTFAPGETEKFVTIPVIDDAFGTSVEGAQNSFNLILGNQLGAAVSMPNVATITINNNDAETSQINPVDTVDGFVRQQYLDFFSREPDAAGFNFWKESLQGSLNNCGSANTPEANNCRADARTRVSEAFFISIEFQQTGYLVFRLYQTLDPTLRTRGLPRFREFLRDTQSVGRGVIVRAEGWEATLEANRQQFLREFMGRSEFVTRFPLGMTRDEFISAVYQSVGVTPTAEELEATRLAYGMGEAEGRAKVLRSVVETRELYFREFNKAFVLMQYFGYLRRNPNEGQDADYAGYDFWLRKLDDATQRAGGYRSFRSAEEAFVPTRQAEMVKAFIVSGEYRGRFGQ